MSQDDSASIGLPAAKDGPQIHRTKKRLKPRPTLKAKSKADTKTQIAGWLQIILVIGVLLAGVAANAILSSSSTAPRQRVAGSSTTPVEVIRPRIEDKPFKVTGSGVIQSRNAIDLSPELSGRVVSVSPNLASGGSFKAGDVLFSLDQASLNAVLEQSQADLSSARANLRVERAEAAVAIEEWELLYADEPVPSLVAREPQISQALAAVQSAQAALEEAQLDLSRVNFSLPFSGRIVSTTIEVGQNLTAGQSYGSAYDGTNLEISVPVSARALGFLQPAEGRDARIFERDGLTQHARSYAAKVTRVDAELNSETRQATVTLAFTEDTSLLPGTFVEVEIDGPIIAGAHLVPERAISQDRIIWVVTENTLAVREPRFLFPQDGFVVTEAFDFADGIVVSPLLDPLAGAVVTIVTPVDADANDE